MSMTLEYVYEKTTFIHSSNKKYFCNSSSVFPFCYEMKSLQNNRSLRNFRQTFYIESLHHASVVSLYDFVAKSIL